MSDPNFSRPGAVDLSNLAQANDVPSGGGYVVDAKEADFQTLANSSMQHPIIVEFHSPRDTTGQATASALAQAVNGAGGQFLLARVNVDEEPRLAQALGVQAVPTVVALISGQLAPLFQGTKEPAEIQALLDQVAQAAVANGLTGRAQPTAPAPQEAQTAQPAADPRFDAADAALESGDYETAVQEFDKLLVETPNDTEVIAGRAQAALLARSMGFEPEKIQEAVQKDPDSAEAQLDLADLKVIQGDSEGAFDGLLDFAAGAAPEIKEQVRVRILELFEVVGRSEPVVLKARRRLSTVLF